MLNFVLKGCTTPASGLLGLDWCRTGGLGESQVGSTSE